MPLNLIISILLIVVLIGLVGMIFYKAIKYFKKK